jgi:hypothetical protein
MRIRLEYDDDPVFATVGHRTEQYRTLMVKINGKPFSAWVTLDIVYAYRRDDPNYIREIDKSLVAAMERMLGKIFTEACAAVPEGTDLMIEGRQ